MDKPVQERIQQADKLAEQAKKQMTNPCDGTPSCTGQLDYQQAKKEANYGKR